MERGKKRESIKYLGFLQDISLPSAFKHQIQPSVRPSMPAIGALHNPGLGWSRNFDCVLLSCEVAGFQGVLFVLPVEILAISCGTTFQNGFQTLSPMLPDSSNFLVWFTCVVF